MISAVIYDATPSTRANADKSLAAALNTLAALLGAPGDEIVYCEWAAPAHQASRPEQIWDSLLPATRRLLRIMRPAAGQELLDLKEGATRRALNIAIAVADTRTDPLNRWLLFVEAGAIVMGPDGGNLSQTVHRLPNGLYGFPHAELPPSLCATLVRTDPEACFQLARSWNVDLAQPPALSRDAQLNDFSRIAAHLVSRKVLPQLLSGAGMAMADRVTQQTSISVRAMADGFHTLGFGGGRAPVPTQPEAWDGASQDLIASVANAEEMRLDLAPGEFVRAVVQRVMSLLAGNEAWSARRKSTFVGALDAVSTFPKDAVFLYAGAEPAMFHAIAYGMALMGFRKRLIVTETQAAHIARDTLTHVQICPDPVALQVANAIIFEAAAGDNDADDQRHRATFKNLGDAALRVERGRSALGEDARTIIVLGSGCAGLLEQAKAFATVETRPDVRFAVYAAQPGVQPCVTPAVRRLLRRLAQIAPVTGRERFDIIALAADLRAAFDNDLVLDALHPFGNYARDRFVEAVRASVSAPEAGLNATGGGPLAISAMASSRAWHIADWANCASRISSDRNSWTWERAQVLYAVSHRIKPELFGKTLIVVAQHEPFIENLVEELGPVDVIGVNELTGGAKTTATGILPEGATAVTVAHMTEGSYGLVICPHSSLFQHGLSGLGHYIAGLRPFIAPDGHVFVCSETALLGRAGASRPDLAHAQPDGGAATSFKAAGLDLQDAGEWGWCADDLALVADLDNAAPDSLGFRQGADVFWPTVWAFRAAPGKATPSPVDIKTAFSDQLLGEQIGRLSMAAGASRDSRGIVSDTLSGHVVFGPYLQLAPGVYTVKAMLGLATIDARITGKRRVVVEIGLGSDIVAQKSVALAGSAALDEVNLDFTVAEASDPCEIRVWSDGDALVRINSVVLKRSTGDVVKKKRRVRHLVDATLPRLGIRS